LKAYKSGKLGSNLVRKEEQIVSELLSLFVRLHAKCFNGKGLSDVHESLQTEMLAQLTQDLKERLLSKGMLNKLVLINIAAEAYAENRRPGREAAQAVNNFLRLNVETFNTLLLVFQPELERVSVTRDKPSSAPNAGTNSTEYVSAVGRRMLPALRLYSKWLLVSHEKLHNTLDDTALAVQTKQLWQTYANTLSLLAVTFEVEKLPRLDYMLEEDEDIIGFLPLSTALSDSEPQKSEGLLKKDHKLPYRVHPNEEQLTRVLLLLEDGLKLCGTPGVPIAVVDGTITYQEDGLNTSILPSSSPAGLDSLYRSAGTEQFANPDMLPVPPQTDRPVSLMVGPGGGSVVGSVAPSESASVMVAMNKMVDSLVGPTGGVFDEEDEIDLEEKSDQRSTQKRVGKGPKENPEDEEIVFVGRKGRGRNFQSTGFLPTGATLQTPKKIEAEEGLAGARRLSATINTRNTPLRETFTTQSPISTSRPAFLTDNSVLNTGLTTTFQTQPLQQTSFTSNQVAASARSPASDRPQPGTITAMDLVNQMHIIGHRGPKTATLSRPSIDIGALPPLNRPLGDHNNDIWWTPPPVLPQPPHPPSLPPAPASPPVLSNAGGMTGSGLTGVYSEGDTSLYLYRPDSGWSQSQLPTGAGTSENSQQYGTSGIIQQFGAAENLHHFGTSGNSQQYGSGEDSQPYAYGTAGTSQQYGTGGYSQQYGNGNGS
ncbi:Est1 DNA/RNA binding domain-containing protein, partial [Kalaharituber pfeilii]